MKKRQDGFTLTELVIVIAIIGVITAVAIPTFSSVVKSANKTADVQQMKQINLMLFTGEINKTELSEYSLLSDGWALAYSETENSVVIVDSNYLIVAAENDGILGNSADGYVKVSDLADGGGEGESPDGSQDGNGGGEGESPDGSQDGQAEWWEQIEPLQALPDVNSDDYNALKTQADLNLSGISVIPEGYFKDFTSLKRIYLGENITDIPKNAFNGCVCLEEVRIDGKVTNVGEKAFRNCTSLKSLSLTNLTTLGNNNAFVNCVFDTLEIPCLPKNGEVQFSVANLKIVGGNANGAFGELLNEIVYYSGNELKTVTFINTIFDSSFSVSCLNENIKVYLDKFTAENLGDYSAFFGNINVELIE